jgi:hypothetical protein
MRPAIIRVSVATYEKMHYRGGILTSGEYDVSSELACFRSYVIGVVLNQDIYEQIFGVF